MTMHQHRQSGMTLIEVLVAMFVMTVGLLGLAGLQATSIKDGLATAQRSQVMWLVNELVERMRANPDGLATDYTGTVNTAACATPPDKLCADTKNGDAALDCNAAEMAEYDVWDVFCGLTEANVIANSTDSLNLDQVLISCEGGATCSDTDEFTVRISWTSKVVTDSKLIKDTDGQKSRNLTMVVRP